MAIKLPAYGFEDVMDDESYGTNPAGEDITQNELQGQEGDVQSMPVTLPPFYVTASPVTSPLGFGVFDFNQGFDPETYGFATNIFQGGMGLGEENTGEVITLPPFVVTADRLATLPPITFEPEQTDEVTSVVVGTGEIATTTGEIVTLPPFVVTETRDATTPLVITTPVNIFTAPTGETENTDVVTLPPFVVTADRITTPSVGMTTPPITLATTAATEETGPVTLPPFVVTENRLPTLPPVTFTTPTVSVAAVTLPPVTLPPATTVAPTTTPTVTTPPPTTATPQPTGFGGGGTAGGTSTGTMSAQRDFDAELRDTLKSLQKYQPEIQRMYGDLYRQFTPAGITAAEPGIIGQYQADLARLQQRQAGMLSPEDVRQSQQSAREAYGARGQVMGPGAIGAEILNREAIRQQREEQARAALQSSYGNILNMSNIQTGNLFSPIASLMSSTFNPLGAYPADVYGTNVNAQLARDIAQKNYEAAIRSAELSGAAQKQAATTSIFGDLLGALPGLIKLCWVAREVYGEDNPKWMQFRDWMFRHAPAWFFNFYLENGEKIAAWLKRHPWAKRPIRMWMDSRIRSMEKRELALKEAV
jgi:hypothetical protein